MSPEQARGRTTVDKRADIWAFGCVLFEMLTGRRCFDGEDTSSTLAAVIKAEPDWKALPAARPPWVSSIKGCLQKDARQRIRDIGDVRLALDGAFLPASHLNDRTARLGPRQRLALATSIGLLLAAIGVLALWRPRIESPVRSRVNRFTISLPPGTTIRDVVAVPMGLTADGRRLVLHTSRDGLDRVLVRRMDQVDLQPIPGLEGVIGSLFLSPDGEWVGFNDTTGSLKRVRLDGGPAATIGETGLTGSGLPRRCAGLVTHGTHASCSITTATR